MPPCHDATGDHNTIHSLQKKKQTGWKCGGHGLDVLILGNVESLEVAGQYEHLALIYNETGSLATKAIQISTLNYYNSIPSIFSSAQLHSAHLIQQT